MQKFPSLSSPEPCRRRENSVVVPSSAPWKGEVRRGSLIAQRSTLIVHPLLGVQECRRMLDKQSLIPHLSSLIQFSPPLEGLGVGSSLMIQSARINHRLSSIITTQNHKQIAYHSSLLVVVKLYNTLGRQLVKSHLNH